MYIMCKYNFIEAHYSIFADRGSPKKVKVQHIATSAASVRTPMSYRTYSESFS